MIALVNYGMGNLRSVEKALESLQCQVNVTDKPKDLLDADGIILPGVGSFYDCMNYLREKELDKALLECLNGGKPYLGICLGLQVLFEKSYEGGGTTKGLSYFKGSVRKLPRTVKVPHMGWNLVNPKVWIPLFSGIEEPIYAYFVHSFYADAERDDILCTTDYGIRFCSGVVRYKTYGLQFHPEKSGEKGLQILKNFVELVE